MRRELTYAQTNRNVLRDVFGTWRRTVELAEMAKHNDTLDPPVVLGVVQDLRRHLLRTRHHHGMESSKSDTKSGGVLILLYLFMLYIYICVLNEIGKALVNRIHMFNQHAHVYASRAHLLVQPKQKLHLTSADLSFNSPHDSVWLVCSQRGAPDETRVSLNQEQSVRAVPLERCALVLQCVWLRPRCFVGTARYSLFPLSLAFSILRSLDMHP